MQPFLPTLLFLLVPLLPVAVALIVQAHPSTRRVAPWVPLSALLLLPLTGEMAAYPWLLLGARVGLDPAMAPLLLLAAVTWSVAGWHAARTLDDKGSTRFWFFWLATWCGNLCVFITLDAASFYAAYAMMTFAAWGLVVHYRRPADRHAGRVYLIMALAAEVLILSGLFLTGAELGNPTIGPGKGGVAALDHADTAALLFALGFGVKMGVVGLHMWLPLAHPQAPVPASAVLSGVILKAGLAGWLHFLPLGLEGFSVLGTGMLFAGLATAFYGVAIGLCQTAAKVVLAYSSVSQMGLLTVIVALTLLDPERASWWTGVATLFALHHGLAKAALFIGVDIAARAPLLARWLLWLPAASLAGLPLTSGALTKVWLKSELPASPIGLEGALLAGSLATTLLLLRFLWLTWPALVAPAVSARGAVAPWLALLSAGVGLPWIVAALTEPELMLRPFAPAYFLEMLLPVAVGLLLTGVLRHSTSEQRMPRLPPGDLIALLPQPRWSMRPLLAHAPVTSRWSVVTIWLNPIERATARTSIAVLVSLLGLTTLFILGRIFVGA